MNNLKNQTKNDLEKFILNLDGTSLRHLNRIVVERLKLLSQMKASMQLTDFHNGQKVAFKTPDDTVLFGVILRLNKKTASVLTEDGVQWNVHHSFLTKM